MRNWFTPAGCDKLVPMRAFQSQAFAVNEAASFRYRHISASHKKPCSHLLLFECSVMDRCKRRLVLLVSDEGLGLRISKVATGCVDSSRDDRLDASVQVLQDALQLHGAKLWMISCSRRTIAKQHSKVRIPCPLLIVARPTALIVEVKIRTGNLNHLPCTTTGS